MTDGDHGDHGAHADDDAEHGQEGAGFVAQERIDRDTESLKGSHTTFLVGHRRHHRAYEA